MQHYFTSAPILTNTTFQSATTAPMPPRHVANKPVKVIKFIGSLTFLTQIKQGAT
jgi:hypothetical protein